MYYEVRNFLRRCINDYMQNLASKIDIILEHPKDKSHGHFATTIAFSIAKIQKTNPRDIASSLALVIKNAKNTIFSEVKAVNGYINLTLSLEFLDEAITKALQKGEDFAKIDPTLCNYAKQRVLLEYVSANPTGPLHIGHARGAIYGDALQRIANYLGDEFECEYYVNDAGTQMQMLAYSLLNALQELGHCKNIIFKDKELYKGEYIKQAAMKFLELKIDTNPIDEDSLIKLLSEFGLEVMLSLIKSNLSSLDIRHDYFVSEASIYKSFEEVLQKLEQKDAIYRQDGSIWLKSSLRGDEKDRVLVRSSGEPTYMAGDMLYHADKFERNYDKYINIWGADHHGYIARIKASLEFLGFDSSRLMVLLSQMVSLLKDGKPYKMSKRAGNFILIQDVVNDIGKDALRFVFLSKSLDTHLEFDVSALNKQDSTNPIFYINYANSRIKTLLLKSSCSNEDILASSLASIKDVQMGASLNALLVNALDLSYILQQSYRDYEPHKICDYLKNLAKNLHNFYNSFKILESHHEAQILKVFLVVSLSLSVGFKLLGIEIKESM